MEYYELGDILMQIQEAFDAADMELDDGECQQLVITGVVFHIHKKSGRYVHVGKKDTNRETKFEIIF